MSDNLRSTRRALALWLELIVLSIALAGCTMGTVSRAPVGGEAARTQSTPAARVRQAPQPAPSVYKVRRGDTLYAIAWRYGLDYRDIARWNAIDPPYLIYADDLLMMSNRRVPRAASPPRTVARPAPGATTPRRTVVTRVPPRPRTRPAWIVTRHGAKRPSVATAPPATPPPARRSGPSRADSNAPVSAWKWPTRGKVIRSFAQTERNGIDIAGTEGQPVVAAADGRVVYAGNGLRGYGLLVIVKHNTRFLSAYAHNARLLVNEGDEVTAGQRVAEMGSTGTDRVKLHFEIRRDGKPVDPRRYLR